jgi:hypothetical protein
MKRSCPCSHIWFGFLNNLVCIVNNWICIIHDWIKLHSKLITLKTQRIFSMCFVFVKNKKTIKVAKIWWILFHNLIFWLHDCKLRWYLLQSDNSLQILQKVKQSQKSFHSIKLGKNTNGFRNKFLCVNSELIQKVFFENLAITSTETVGKVFHKRDSWLKAENDLLK